MTVEGGSIQRQGRWKSTVLGSAIVDFLKKKSLSRCETHL